VTDCSSIPEAQEGAFDLAVCVYVLCNLVSKEEVLLSSQQHLLFFQEILLIALFFSFLIHFHLDDLGWKIWRVLQVQRALAEIYKLLKPGGKLMISETHVVQYLQWDDESAVPFLYKWVTSKEDGTKWGYFEDEGKPREVILWACTN
jgi:SAM-dependent methyltransferase